MYSLNLLSCLILLVLGSIYVLTKPLSIGNKIPTESSGVAIPDKIFLDDIALALVQNFDESSSSDEDGLIFDEGHVPADTDSSSTVAGTAGAVAGAAGAAGAAAGASSSSTSTTSNNSSSSSSSSSNGNGSIIGSETKVNSATAATGNNSSKSGVVVASDGSSTSLANTRIDSNGNVVDGNGSTVAKVDKTGVVTDNKGNTVAKVDDNGNVIDNNNNNVATVAQNGNITPIVPFAAGTGSSSSNSSSSVSNNNSSSNTSSNTSTNTSTSTTNNGNSVDANGNNANSNAAAANTNNGNTNANNGNANANSNTNTSTNTNNTTTNNKSESGVVTGPDGTSTNIANSTIDNNGNVVDSSGNTVGKVQNNGNIVDNKGNTVGQVDSNGNIIDNNGNTVAKVDNNGKVTATDPSTSSGKAPDAVDNGSRDAKNKKRGGFLYVLLPALALVGGAGAFLYKSKYVNDVIGGAPAETVTEMNNIGAAPAAATTTTTTTTTTKTYGSGLPYEVTKTNGPATTTKYTTYTTNHVAPAAGAAGAPVKETDISTTALPAVETGPSMESIIKEVETVENQDASMLPAVLAAGAGAAAVTSANSKEPTTTKKYYKTYGTPAETTETIYETRYGPAGTTKTLNNVNSAPKTTTTSKYYTTPVGAAGAPYETTETIYETRYGPNSTKSSKNKYLLGAAPVAAVGAAALASKKKDDEEVVEEYIVEHGAKPTKKTNYKTIYRNGVPVQVPADEEVIEEYIIEEADKAPKKTGKKTITTYKTIYKNGVPVQVPVTEEVSDESRNAVVAGTENPYKNMIPSVIETIVKHSQPLGDKAEEVKKADYEKLFALANIPVPSQKALEKTESGKPKKTVKRTVYKTIYKNGLPIQVPVEEEVEEETSKTATIKSPKLKGIKKRITTYVTKDGKQVEVPVTEEFSLNPKDVPGEIPTEYSTEEFDVPSRKATKQKTIKKYITVYKTVYKNGKPEEVVENIEVPEGKTPEEVLATLPRGTHVKKPEESVVEKRYVKPTVVETPTKEEIVEERVVKPTVVKSPKVHSVKKYVTTYKTTYKNGVPVEETTETEDVPDQSTTETTYVTGEPTTEVKSPKMKTIKKVTTYKTIYKNGKPVEVVEEVPQETVIQANPVIVSQTKNVTVPKDEVSEETLGKEPNVVKKLINKFKKGEPQDETEEIVEEYVIEEGADPKNVKRTVYRNGVPVTETSESRTAPFDGDETEEIVEEYVIEEGANQPAKTVKKTVYRNGVEVPESNTRDLSAVTSVLTGGSNPYIKLAPHVISNIVKYAIPGAKNDTKTDSENLMNMFTDISKFVSNREAPEQQPESSDRDLSSLVSAVSGQGSNPYLKMAPYVIKNIVKYAIPGANNDSKTDLGELMNMMKLLGGKREVIEETSEQKPNFHFRIPLDNNKGIRSSEQDIKSYDADQTKDGKEVTDDAEEYDLDEYSEALPSIIEEDESLPMENNRSFETISPTEGKKFGRRTLPKRSSSKRLSLELKAAVAAEIAKLENEINDEVKNLPKPRKQSISQGTKQNLARKESAQSIKAMAEGCLVRKPSNASSIKSNHSITEEWSGPVFEKKVFEVVIEHTPQLPDEVKLNIGDLVEVKQVFEDGWAYGINTASKVDGTFPVNCLGEEREPNKNGRYVPRLIRVYQAREEAGKKEKEDEEKFKHDLTEYAKKKKEYKLKKQQKKSKY